jgi:hypothetical protein
MRLELLTTKRDWLALLWIRIMMVCLDKFISVLVAYYKDLLIHRHSKFHNLVCRMITALCRFPAIFQSFNGKHLQICQLHVVPQTMPWVCLL